LATPIDLKGLSEIRRCDNLKIFVKRFSGIVIILLFLRFRTVKFGIPQKEHGSKKVMFIDSRFKLCSEFNPENDPFAIV